MHTTCEAYGNSCSRYLTKWICDVCVQSVLLPARIPDDIEGRLYFH